MKTNTIATRKQYMKPTLVKQVIGVMNKFGNANPRNVKDEIDGANVDDMLQQYGSPLFVFSERQLRRQIRRLKQAFQTRYPAMVFSWSYKTNYLSAICALFHQEGEIAEVVSGFEYAKARKLGMPGNKIVFNGPLKTDEELKVAFTEGAKVHIDNFAELQRAEKVAQSLGKKCPVGIRLNVDTGLYQSWTKFGFNLENSQAYEAASRIARSEWLELTGIHAHIGTFMLDSNPYKIQVEKLVGFMFRVEEQLNCNIEYLDLGGGFPSKNKLKGVYHSPEINIPEIEEFAEVISSALLNSLPPGRTPTVYLETGRHLVDDAGYLLSSVYAQKQMPDGRTGYFIDAGVNLLYTSTWYDFKIQPGRVLGGTAQSCTLYGPLCMNIDVVSDAVYLPPMPIGTPLVISPVGAYNVTQWMQFITYRPAVVMVMDNGQTEIIRRKEVLEDVDHCEVLPEKFKSLSFNN
jgi:diaminopimelate decarboxylase